MILIHMISFTRLMTVIEEEYCYLCTWLNDVDLVGIIISFYDLFSSNYWMSIELNLIQRFDLISILILYIILD
jgi:hypothetical protein